MLILRKFPLKRIHLLKRLEPEIEQVFKLFFIQKSDARILPLGGATESLASWTVRKETCPSIFEKLFFEDSELLRLSKSQSENREAKNNATNPKRYPGHNRIMIDGGSAFPSKCKIL